MRKIIIRKKIFISIIFILFIWMNNSSLFLKSQKNNHMLLAHRGLAQTFEIKDVKWNTDTSKIIHNPEHPYLENTLESMKKAFELGADIVEFDVRLTRDNKLVVFHDYDLSFRTNGKGLVIENDLKDIKKLDAGYGYTADGGKTFPFRGKGVRKIPSIDQVLNTFSDKQLLIHIKDGGIKSAIILESFFKNMSKSQLSKLSAYGNKEAILYLQKKYPNMKLMTKSILKKALIKYFLIGWTGYIPKDMRNLEIYLPLKYAKFLWGWPHKFLNRINSVNSRFTLVIKKGNYSDGFDNKKDFLEIPENYSGTIWTNRIDIASEYFNLIDKK